jgi:hypothetical protein
MNIETALQTDLVELANQAGASMKKCKGDWRGACPIHRGDNDNGFAVYMDGDKWRWKCYTRDCGSGDVIDFVVAWRGMSLKDAIRYLGGDIPADPAELARMATERRIKAEAYAKQKQEEYKLALVELRQARRWETYYHNLENNEHARELWRARGIPDVFQSIWQFGYCDKFSYSTKEGTFTTPTLTIPIFGDDPEPVTIRHRLLNPFRPNDKYRPEKPGLHSAPFMADPGKDKTLERIIIIEGEIKAAVTYITLDDPNIQVYGVPGKNAFASIKDKLAGRQVWICYDPDAQLQATKDAKEIHARLIEIPTKIDDAILAGFLDREAIRRLMKSAKAVT